MGSVFVIVGNILTPKPSKVGLVERDDMVKQLAANTANPTFSSPVLPRASHGRSFQCDAARLQKGVNLTSELRIAIEQNIAVGAGQW